MKLYLADVYEEDLHYEVTFPADSFETAEMICTKRDWELIGELIEELLATDSVIDAISNRIH